MKKKIFIPVYGGGHCKLIISLYDSLIRKFDVTILALTLAEEYLSNHEIPYKTLKDYLEYIDLGDKIVQLGDQFIKENNIDYERIGLYNSSIYYGCNIRDYILKYGEDDIVDSYGKQNRLIFLPINTMEAILKIENPDAVLTTNSPRFERASILAAKNLGITNYSIEDLLGNSRVFSLKDTNTDYYGDYIFVLNNFVRENLINQGVKAKKIVVSGLPTFDNLKNHYTDIFNFKQRYGIDLNKKIITWASHVSEDEIYIFEELLKVFTLNNEYLLIIKPHPNENYSYMEKMLAKIHTNSIRLIENCDIRDLINISELLLTQYSTCGLEALFMQTPVIVLNPFDKKYDTDYSSLNIASKCQDLSKILINIEEKKQYHLNFEVINNSINNMINFIDNTI